MAERKSPGLQAVPRGLGQALTSYLQSLDTIVRMLSGQVRGAQQIESNGAQRQRTTGTTTSDMTTSTTIATGAVTTDKIANGSVDTIKLAQGCVTSEKIATWAIAEHLKQIISIETGSATNGAIVSIGGQWQCQPTVFISGISIDSETLFIGPKNMKENTPGVWQFEAKGRFTWVAIGYRRAGE